MKHFEVEMFRITAIATPPDSHIRMVVTDGIGMDMLTDAGRERFRAVRDKAIAAFAEAAAAAVGGGVYAAGLNNNPVPEVIASSVNRINQRVEDEEKAIEELSNQLDSKEKQ